MSRFATKSLGVWFTLAMASSACAQGFTLNPFVKEEPEPTAIRRSVSDAPPQPTESSFFQFPTLPAPQLPELWLPQPQWPDLALPSLSLPGMGSSMPAAPGAPRQPNMFERLNKNTLDFFSKTNDFITAPFRSAPEPSRTGTRARMASASRRKPASGGLFQLPSWLGGEEEPPEPQTVNGFLNQRRPGFED